MQNRMKTHQLSGEEVNALLAKCQTGTLATLDPDGAPYVVPVHYALFRDALYVHGLPVGQKIGNLQRDPRVCFNVYEMQGLLLDPEGKPCDTNTVYVSVVVRGAAQVVEDLGEKQAALAAIVGKYTPHLAEKEIPDNMVKGTAVFKITMEQVTGKFYS